MLITVITIMMYYLFITHLCCARYLWMTNALDNSL